MGCSSRFSVAKGEDFDWQIGKLVDVLLRLDVDQRFGTADDVSNALEACDPKLVLLYHLRCVIHAACQDSLRGSRDCSLDAREEEKEENRER